MAHPDCSPVPLRQSYASYAASGIIDIMPIFLLCRLLARDSHWRRSRLLRFGTIRGSSIRRPPVGGRMSVDQILLVRHRWCSAQRLKGPKPAVISQRLSETRRSRQSCCCPCSPSLLSLPIPRRHPDYADFKWRVTLGTLGQRRPNLRRLRKVGMIKKSA